MFTLSGSSTTVYADYEIGGRSPKQSFEFDIELLIANHRSLANSSILTHPAAYLTGTAAVTYALSSEITLSAPLQF